MSILTILSHVVHGYVGNKAIVFPLQSQGWEVDVINTVNYSNHTGYGEFRGDDISPNLLETLLKNPRDYDYVISGYIPNKELIDIFLHTLNKITGIYVLDPILGDEHQLYVNRTCIEGYRTIIDSGRVDIATPNQFELELLTGKESTTMQDVLDSIEILLDKVRHVVVTSARFDDDYIYCFVSSEKGKVNYFKVPIMKSYFTGVGDMFAGLLVHRFHHTKDLTKAVNQVLSIMRKVLQNTQAKGIKESNGIESVIGSRTIGYYELEVIGLVDVYGHTDEDFEVYST